LLAPSRDVERWMERWEGEGWWLGKVLCVRRWGGEHMKQGRKEIRVREMGRV